MLQPVFSVFNKVALLFVPINVDNHPFISLLLLFISAWFSFIYTVYKNGVLFIVTQDYTWCVQGENKPLYIQER